MCRVGVALAYASRSVVSVVTQNSKDPIEYREAQFKKLGYEPTAARILAYSKDKAGVPLYAPDIKKQIERMQAKGMSSDDALSSAFRIYADDVRIPEVEDDEDA